MVFAGCSFLTVISSRDRIVSIHVPSTKKKGEEKSGIAVTFASDYEEGRKRKSVRYVKKSPLDVKSG